MLFGALTNIPKHCAVFWDIENVSVSSGESARQVIKLIRDKIHYHGSKEVEFICINSVGKLSPSIKRQIKSSRVKINNINGNQRNAAHLKITELIKQFVKAHGKTNECSIVLISGDSHLIKTLIKCKLHYKIEVFLVHCDYHRNDFLDAVADEVYLLSNGQLEQVTRSSDIAVVKVTIPLEASSSVTIRSESREIVKTFEYFGAIKDSFVFDANSNGIWFKFRSKELAKKIAQYKHFYIYHNYPLIVDYVHYPPDYVVDQLIYDGKNALQFHNFRTLLMLTPKSRSLVRSSNITSSVREETLNNLRILIPNSFSSSRTSLTSSTLSLPLAASSVYVIVTGFPHHHSSNQRCRYLAQLLDESIEKFNSTSSHVWFPVDCPYQAKRYIDKINDSNGKEFKLSATIDKQSPPSVISLEPPLRPIDGQYELFVIEQSKPNHDTDDDVNLCRFKCIKFFTFITITIILIIGCIYWFK